MSFAPGRIHVVRAVGPASSRWCQLSLALVPGTASLWSTWSYFRSYDQIAGPYLAVRIRAITPLAF